MQIQYCSDLHLEFPENRRWLEANPLIPSAEILVIAGDCFYLGDDYRQYNFIRRVADEFEAVYILPGNHEYYGGYDVATAMQPTFEPIQDNVFLVNNTAVEIQGVRLIFSTMWSLINKNIREIINGLTDFRQIRCGGEPFTVNHFNALHEKAFEASGLALDKSRKAEVGSRKDLGRSATLCLSMASNLRRVAAFEFLKEEVAKEGKKLVFTHHLPSNECNIEQFKGSVLNPAFCVEKTWFVSASDVSAWVYGHSHRNMPDFEINGTRMLTNQLGYVGWGEHHAFRRDKVVRV